MNHRGRFQAQGGGLEEFEPWSEEAPLPVAVGHCLLNRLEAKIHPREAAIRRDSFKKARRFIDSAAAGGGVGPPPPCKKNFSCSR